MVAVPYLTTPSISMAHETLTTKENVMLKNRLRHIARKLLILLVVAVPLLVTSTDPVGRRAVAVPCEECENLYNQCIASCEPCSSAALFFCENRYNKCVATCT